MSNFFVEKNNNEIVEIGKQFETHLKILSHYSLHCIISDLVCRISTEWFGLTLNCLNYLLASCKIHIDLTILTHNANKSI